MGNAIDNALSGLLSAQARIDVTARNISGASIDGYTRKTQNVGTQMTGGVLILDVSRQVDSALVSTSRDLGGDIGGMSAQADALTSLEARFGQPGDGTTLADQLANLKASFQALSVNPSDIAAQQSTVYTAQGLARTFNNLYDAAVNIGNDLTAKASVQVEQANALLQNIHRLNNQISAIQAGSSDSTELEDQRDQALQQLGGIIGITSFMSNGGQTAVYTKGGQLLVDNSVSTLKIDPLTHAVTVQPGGGGSAVPISLSGGSLSGILQTRDVTLPAFRSQLDDIAASLTQGVAAAGVALFNDGGSVPYAAANKTGFADRIAVDSAITANPALVRDSSGLTPSGDTTAIANVLGFFDSTATTFAAPGLPAQGKIGDVAGALVANYSTMRANLQSQRDQQTAVKESIDQRLANEDGVNVDQELTQLIQLQNSYAANAKVLETVNQLYQQLISMV